MIRVLLDTNVLLDALLDREPWVAETRSLREAHLRGRSPVDKVVLIPSSRLA
jgi:hypothetical protein